MQRLCLTIAVIMASSPAWAQDPLLDMAPPGMPSPTMPSPGGPLFATPGGPGPSAVRLPAAEGPLWQPSNATAPVRPTPSVAVPPAAAGPVFCERFVESTWYTRVDYFHWNERLDGEDFVNEYGTLVTLGYQRRIGPERFRIELFGGTMRYVGGAQFDDGTSEPLSSSTGYLGVRGEYDLMIEPACWPNVSLFVGIGTRFWVRDLKDGVTDFGTPVAGYQETWWTIYPYLGIEKRRVPHDGVEFYYSGRIGFTLATYQYVSWFDTTLYPKPGITGQFEAGVRGSRLFLSAYFETMCWSESDIVRDSLQPDSRMFTVGLKTGFSF